MLNYQNIISNFHSLGCLDTISLCCILLVSFDKTTQNNKPQKHDSMNSDPNSAQEKSALKRLRERALAFIILPTWPDDIMHATKAERTRMLLCILIKNLETYFKGRVSCIANACAIAYNSGERVTVAREVANETIGIIDNNNTNMRVEMSNWQTLDPESIASEFLEILGENFRFLFLISDDTSPMKVLGKLFPNFSVLSEPYYGNAGECFMCCPSAGYYETVKLPGSKVGI